MNPGSTKYRLLAIAALFISSLPFAIAAEPAPLSKDWTFDVIRLKNGYMLKGLILEETAYSIRFQHVRRATGRPTISMTSSVRRDDIDRIDKLGDDARETLKNRLKELDPSGDGERQRMESLSLDRCDWNGKPKAGWRYDSDYFSLTSNAPEEVVRRSAVKLEQIYTAYAAFLPPRFPGGKPSSIILYPAVDDYQQMLGENGWKLQNLAFFNPDSNRVFCGSNLLMLGNDLESTRLKHQELRAELDKEETKLRKLYKRPQELTRFLEPVQALRKRMTEYDKYNDAIFDSATQRFFGILYHEAFHAYVSNFVYPPLIKDVSEPSLRGELPRWLNEGLAQIFETAIVEAGELRVGHADKDRLRRAKDAIRKGEWMTVPELLAAGPKVFLVQHNNNRVGSERAYLASWALTAYLTFDRRLLGSKELDLFVRAVNQGGNVETAFVQLTGQKLPEFDKQFQTWLLKVPEDGSLLDPGPGKNR